jgi:hypothetical protein
LARNATGGWTTGLTLSQRAAGAEEIIHTSRAGHCEAKLEVRYAVTYPFGDIAGFSIGAAIERLPRYLRRAR